MGVFFGQFLQHVYLELSGFPVLLHILDNLKSHDLVTAKEEDKRLQKKKR